MFILFNNISAILKIIQRKFIDLLFIYNLLHIVIDNKYQNNTLKNKKILNTILYILSSKLQLINTQQFNVEK